MQSNGPGSFKNRTERNGPRAIVLVEWALILLSPTQGISKNMVNLFFFFLLKNSYTNENESKLAPRD